MKHITILLVAFFTAVSCLGPATYSWSETVVATFDYSNASDVFGKDSVYCRSDLGWQGLMAFCNEADSLNNDLYGGFALSRFLGDSLDTTQPFKVYDNAKKPVDNTYLVFEQSTALPKRHFRFLLDKNGTCVMKFCFLNNTVQVVDYVRKNFSVGDKLMVQATGYKADKQTGMAEFVLAEKSAVKDSLVTQWRQFDLAKLGAVDAVDFKIVSNKEVPQYFCMDNFVANVAVSVE